MPTLNWLTKDTDIRAASRAPYRLLEEASDLSAGNLESGNTLIQGDNLQALKALLPFYAGRVKCIYIDPPYNTGAAFEHYDDNLEHTQWLAMMWPRLELLREFLAVDGFFLCQIDDAQGSYLKVLCDEVFGRNQYQTSLYIQVRYAQKTLKQDMKYHKQIEHVLVYRSSRSSSPNQIPNRKANNFEKFHFEVIEKTTGEIKNIGGKKVQVFKKNEFDIIKHKQGWIGGLKEIWATGTILDGNSSGRFFRDYLTGRTEYDGLGVLYKVPNIGDDGKGFRYFTGPKRSDATKGKYYQGVPLDKQEDTKETFLPVPNFYNHADAFGNCRLEGGADFRSGKKPEAWIGFLLERFSNPGDLILDSFLGSGTTAAVAHKMGRRYIGVEMGEHAVTHCAPRLNKVIKGEQGGISKGVGWKGGGGFRFYRLGPPVFDENGQIQQDVRFPLLAAHVWFSETGQPWNGNGASPLLGLHDGRAYALLYNGILEDRRPSGGNVLTRAVLAAIQKEIAKQHPGFDGPLTIYGERSCLMQTTLDRKGIVFKQTPYDVKARA